MYELLIFTNERFQWVKTIKESGHPQIHSDFLQTLTLRSIKFKK